MSVDPLSVRRVTVLGGGTMGHAIAQVMAQAGLYVDVVDLQEDVLAKVPSRVTANLQTLAEAGVVNPDEIPAILGRIHTTTDLSTVADKSEFAIEAVNETEAAKKGAIGALEQALPADVVIASNTSGLDIYEFVDAVHPERLVCAHWFAPPYIVPLVEIAGGPDTSQDALQWTAQLLERAGKLPLVMKKFAEAFIANRIMMAMADAAEELMEEGAASIEDIDLVMKASVGTRLGIVGIFQSLDFNGLDLIAEGHAEMGLPVPGYLEEPVAAGHLGAKSGRGLYDYGGRSEEEVVRKRDLAYLAVLQAMEEHDAFNPV